MKLRASLAHAGPLLVIVLAPVLLRLPFWLLGVALSPIWPGAGLTLSAQPPFAPGLPGFIDIGTGWTTQALGTQAARQWLSGQIPWWDPFSGVGLPLAGELESSALFLPYVLLLAAPGGYLLMAMALQVTGGVSAYALMRRLPMTRLAATTGALLFELGGSFGWVGAPCGMPIAFLPLFLLGLEQARGAALGEKGQGYRTIAAAIALSLYAGFPETAYLDGLLALVWAVYRLFTVPVAARLGFLARVGAGGVAGLALAAPALVPFVQVLNAGVIGARQTMDMGLLSMPEPGDALYALPYLLGPIAGYFGNDPTAALVALWGRAGGYLGVPLAIAAVAGLAGAGRHERGLRYVLGGWILACLVRSAAVPGLRHVWDIVPEIWQVQVFRYSGATWMLAASLLAAFAVDDLRHRAPRPGWAWGAAAVLAGATGASIWAGWGLIAPLLASGRGYAWFFWGSLGWGAATAALAIWAFGAARRPALAAGLLALDAGVLFAVPFLSGARHPRLDAGSIEFLQANLGLQRFYSLGPFQPNYAGVFGIASINHNYLPLPRKWPDWVQANLDPNADPILYFGDFPPDRPGEPTHADAVRDNLANYAAIGVRYVLLPAGSPDLVTVPTSASVGPVSPFVLSGAASVEVTVPPGVARAGQVTALGLKLGTYRGRASGALIVEACAEACASGAIDLAAAVDNEETTVELRPPLAVAAGQSVEVRISRTPGADVALWLWPNPGRTVRAGRVMEGVAPYLALIYADTRLHVVHRSSVMTIVEVAGAAPYYEADPGCEVVPQGRQRVTVRCPEPSSLQRRELWYPGWSASIDGVDAPVLEAGPLFQAVRVPAGESEVRFAYRPPGFAAFFGVFAIGALMLLPWGRVRSIARPGTR